MLKISTMALIDAKSQGRRRWDEASRLDSPRSPRKEKDRQERTDNWAAIAMRNSVPADFGSSPVRKRRRIEKG